MANSPNTGSTLTLPNGTNKTSTAISTNMIIMVGSQAVGAIQTLSINESRTIRQVDEVGTDGHVDSVPMKSTDISGSCDRVRYDRLRIAEAFSRGFLHASSQVYPFDIVILDKQKRDQGSQISTVIKNVWIKSISYTYSATDWVIVDKMDWEAERIFSILNGGSSPIPGGVPAAQGGERALSFASGIISGDGIRDIERLADTGAAGRGGSLDAPGLIDIGTSPSLF